MLVHMRRLRRLAALVASLLMTNVVVASGATACPMGDDWANSTVASAQGVEHFGSTARHHESMPGHHDSSPSRPAHHHVPGASHCTMACPPSGCAAFGHCGSVSLTDRRDEGPAAFSAANNRVFARTLALHSVSTAPEPPPPRV